MSQILEQISPSKSKAEYHKKYKLRNKTFYRKYMNDKKCSKCESIKDLHNHHTEPNNPNRRDKRLGIYYMVRSGYSIRSIIEELKHTIVLCRICHCAETVRLNSDKDK